MATPSTTGEKYWFYGLPVVQQGNDTGGMKYWFYGLPGDGIEGSGSPPGPTLIPRLTLLGAG